MELEADLIEELARFYGYQNIPTTFPRAKRPERILRFMFWRMPSGSILVGQGYSEAVNLSFAAEAGSQGISSAARANASR